MAKRKSKPVAHLPAKQREGRAAAPAAARSPGEEPLVADPPRPHLWFLLASGAGVLGWMLFLLVLALRG